MDYKELVEHLKEWNENLISEMCADDVLTCDDLCGCTGDCIVVQAAIAIIDLLSRAEAAEAQAEKAKSIASDLCDDFTDFVTGGVPNAAPYCANRHPECVDERGWCNRDNRVCKGFLPKAAEVKEE